MATIQAHRDNLQKQTQQDWANREYIEIITSSIKKITDFLNSFGTCPLCTFANYLPNHELLLFFFNTRHVLSWASSYPE